MLVFVYSSLVLINFTIHRPTMSISLEEYEALLAERFNGAKTEREANSLFFRRSEEGASGSTGRAAASFLTKGVQASKSIYRCRKCKGTNVESTEVQTRSCDEAATIVCCCKNVACGYSWRQ